MERDYKYVYYSLDEALDSLTLFSKCRTLFTKNHPNTSIDIIISNFAKLPIIIKIKTKTWVNTQDQLKVKLSKELLLKSLK